MWVLFLVTRHVYFHILVGVSCIIFSYIQVCSVLYPFFSSRRIPVFLLYSIFTHHYSTFHYFFSSRVPLLFFSFCAFYVILILGLFYFSLFFFSVLLGFFLSYFPYAGDLILLYYILLHFPSIELFSFSTTQGNLVFAGDASGRLPQRLGIRGGSVVAAGIAYEVLHD